MNPEFRRNLLLELSPQRLVAMPIILFMLYGAAGLINEEAVSGTASVVIFVLLVLWGSRLSADAVLGEVAGRTWDSQRMSALGPWSMGWGKLLGSTIFMWYGAILSTPAYLFEKFAAPSVLITLLMVGLLAQALSLFTSLVVQRLRPEKLRFHVSLAQLAGLAGAIMVWKAMPADLLATTRWYGTTFGAVEFGLVSGGVFLAWCCYGIYRLMRAELQFRCWPVGWSAFTVFAAFYAAGFAPSWQVPHGPVLDTARAGPILRLFWAYLVIAGLTWVAAFAEPKGFVRMRRWREMAGGRSAPHILRVTPSWAPGLLVALIAGILLAVSAQLTMTGHYFDAIEEMFSASAASVASFSIALFLFLLRDIGIIHLLTMDGRSRRALFTVLVNFAVLYGLLPAILLALDFGRVVPALLPSPVGQPLAVILPVLVQVLVVAGLIVWRWGRLARSMGEGEP